VGQVRLNGYGVWCTIAGYRLFKSLVRAVAVAVANFWSSPAGPSLLQILCTSSSRLRFPWLLTYLLRTMRRARPPRTFDLARRP
jgi:hypothetical protein